MNHQLSYLCINHKEIHAEIDSLLTHELIDCRYVHLNRMGVGNHRIAVAVVAKREHSFNQQRRTPVVTFSEPCKGADHGQR